MPCVRRCDRGGREGEHDKSSIHVSGSETVKTEPEPNLLSTRTLRRSPLRSTVR